MQRLLTTMLGVLLFASIAAGTASGQTTQGRWLIGFHGGANLWLSDFDQQRVSPGFHALVRYGLTPSFSLGALVGYNELKTQNSVILPPEFPYGYQKLRGWDLQVLMSFHFLSRRTFSPYAYIGAGGYIYTRQTQDGIYIPDDKLNFSVQVPLGLGFDLFLSRNVSWSLMAGYTAISDKTDYLTKGGLDGYVSVRTGVNLYLGSNDQDDDDEDGLTNGQERRVGTNPQDADTDGDRLKDGEEVKRYRSNPLISDTDGDGIPDGEEVLVYKSDPAKLDTDDDGLSDGDEVKRYKTDPTRPDSDADGLTDGEEVLRTETDPLRVDTDGDGLSDWDEVRVHKSSPSMEDSDGDGLKDGEEVKKYKTDPAKTDTDGGSISDRIEVQRGTNPLDPKDDVAKDALLLQRGRTIILEGVTFEGTSAKLSREAERTLGKAHTALSSNPDLTVEIAGYTDNQGDPRRNQQLSQQRAESVRTWLVRKGIDPSRLTAVGYGMRNPIATNLTPEGREKNRRIEFRVK